MTLCHKVVLLSAVSVGLVAAPSAPATGDGVGRCRTAQLHLRPGAYGEAALQFTQTLTFTNASARRCELEGWPRVRVRDERGRDAAATIVRVVQGPPGARPFRRVELGPGRAASFDVYGADWNAAANRPCQRASGFLVTPPGGRTALAVRVRVPDCGRFYVAPLVPGTRDRDSWSVVWRR